MDYGPIRSLVLRKTTLPPPKLETFKLKQETRAIRVSYYTSTLTLKSPKADSLLLYQITFDRQWQKWQIKTTLYFYEQHYLHYQNVHFNISNITDAKNKQNYILLEHLLRMIIKHRTPPHRSKFYRTKILIVFTLDLRLQTLKWFPLNC